MISTGELSLPPAEGVKTTFSSVIVEILYTALPLLTFASTLKPRSATEAKVSPSSLYSRTAVVFGSSLVTVSSSKAKGTPSASGAIAKICLAKADATSSRLLKMRRSLTGLLMTWWTRFTRNIPSLGLSRSFAAG